MSMKNPLDGLNPTQREAAEHREGPLLLLAGAGSGKTRVVTTRIASLLQDGVPAAQILALTFTNKAAREMRERVASLLGVADEPPVLISTFHALGARILRDQAEVFGRTRRFSIYDEDDQVVCLRQALEQRGHSFKVPQIKRILRGFARAKNDGLRAGDAVLSAEFIGVDVAQIGEDYEERLKRADAFDFGDLILCPMELFEQHPRAVRMYRHLWKWLLVDEFQDTNMAQFRWLRAMAPQGSNLFVVGDDDQSIYGWRGAEVSNILNFSDHYPSAKTVRLEQNYRSHGRILQAANAVISHNHNRLGKNLWTEKDEGPYVENLATSDGRAEAATVATRIAQFCAQGDIRPADIAVLMRANHLSLDLETNLRSVGIPYRVLRGRAFFERAEVRDALAHVRMLVNPDDESAFRRAIAAPSQGVGKTSMKHLDTYALSKGESLFKAVDGALDTGRIKGKAKGGLSSFVNRVSEAREQDLVGPQGATAVREHLVSMGLLDAPDELDAADPDQQRRENVSRLVDDLYQWAGENVEAPLDDYLEKVKLVSDVDAADDDGAVSLMTVHAAKGLEFPVVFVIAMEEGIFPHASALAENQIEEERRLCYVALTRAMDHLILSRAARRTRFNETQYASPSRFLSELPADVFDRPPPKARPVRRESSSSSWGRPWSRTRSEWNESPQSEASGEFRVGMKIWHAQFGAGEVLKVSRGSRTILQVEFPDMDPVKVVSDFVSPYEG